MTMSTTLAPAETDLSNLAQLINSSHITVLERQQAILDGTSNYLNEKRQVGEYLLQANAQIRHGQWLSWLQENCPNIQKSAAYNYMHIAKNWEEIAFAATELRNVTKFPPSGNLGIKRALKLLEESDEVVEAELIEEENEEVIDGTVDSTPLTTQQEVHTPKEEVSFYRPLIGDTIKINDAEHKLNGKEVKVDDVIDGGAIVLFKTEDGEPGVVFNKNEGIVELITRPYTPPPVSDNKSADSSLSGNGSRQGKKAPTEKELLDSVLEKNDKLEDWGRRMIYCCLSKRMPEQDLLDEGIEMLEIEV